MSHSHHHHSSGHQHVTPETFRAPFSLLSLSALQRLGLALIALALLWGLVFWALQEVA